MKPLRYLCVAVLCALPAQAQARAWDEPFPGAVQDSQSIRGFVGDYRWLSNFYSCEVKYEGLMYQSAEAAYQAAKFPGSERQAFTALGPDAAKKLAHSKPVDDTHWNARKDQVMRDVVWAKFSQHPELGARLLATGDKYLEETNWWNDPYWGVYQGKGRNMLGKILMETRSKILKGRLE
jgi:ribA/ribD-fused uncharacterized protein